MKAGFLVIPVLFVLSAPALAQDGAPPSNIPPEMQEFMKKQGMTAVPGLPGAPGVPGAQGGTSAAPMKLGFTAATIDEISEPEFPEVKFLTPPPLVTLADRVDGILHGLRTPLAPRYDHYGYEIRRYMAKAASPKIMGDKQKVKDELKNVEKAEIIIKYWHKALSEEIDAIEEQIELEDAPALVRSSYSYNTAAARTVMAELQNWIDNNKKMLEFLDKRAGFYKINYPNIVFDNQEDRIRFATLYEARQKSLKNIKEYTPWAMMIY